MPAFSNFIPSCQHPRSGQKVLVRHDTCQFAALIFCDKSVQARLACFKTKLRVDSNELGPPVPTGILWRNVDAADVRGLLRLSLAGFFYSIPRISEAED
jgi:hypothetical protein